MNQKRLSIFASVTTAISFFSSIAEFDNRSVRALLRLSDSHKPAVESEYKSLFYKLWQTLTKNKPSPHDNQIVHSNNKKHFHIQSASASYQPYQKRLKPAENYVTKSNAMSLQKWLWFRYSSLFYNLNDSDIDGCDIFRFVSHVYAVKCILVCIKSVFRNNEIYSCKKQDFGPCNLTLRIYSDIVWHLENLYNIDDSIDKTVYQVYCQ